MEAPPPYDDSGSGAAVRRRRRPALSCVSCRRSKIRCDRKVPCNHCVRSRHKTCVYDAHPADSEAQPTHELRDGTALPLRNEKTDSAGEDGASSSSYLCPQQRSSPEPSSSATTPQSHPSSSSHDVEGLLKRIKQLELRLERSEATIATVPVPATSAPWPETGRPLPSYIAGDIVTMKRGVMAKSRYYGQSHWVNGIFMFQPILDAFEAETRSGDSEVVALLHKCKALGRTIKSARLTQLSNIRFGSNIPVRDVADKLVDGYLRTTESVYRVIHVPSFRAEYEKYWASPEAVDEVFIIQLQLIMAIGSAVYDDEFTMRVPAVRWVQEARIWFADPLGKKSATIAGIQAMTLLCLAGEAVNVDADGSWVHVGTLLRSAMYMGFHRDPARLPKMTQLKAEIRRRLWTTILEIAVNSSLYFGGAPMLATDQFDAAAPANCDDEQLQDTEAPAPAEPMEKFTDTSISLILRESFPVRHGLARLLNNLRSKGSYEETVAHHHQLAAALKTMSRGMRAFSMSGGRQPSDFQRRFLEFLFCRGVMALHVPYVGPSSSQPAYAFSRKTALDMAVKIWNAILPRSEADSMNTPPLFSSGRLRPLVISEIEPVTTEGNDLARLTINGAGYLRSVPKQAAAIASYELREQVLESEENLLLSSGGPAAALRPDLAQVLDDSVRWGYTRCRNGETNIKVYLILMALRSYLDALYAGLDPDARSRKIVADSTIGQQQCVSFLKRHAALLTGGDGNLSGEPAGMNHGAAADGGGYDADPMLSGVIDPDWDIMQGLFYDVAGVETALDPGASFVFSQSMQGPSPW